MNYYCTIRRVVRNNYSAKLGVTLDTTQGISGINAPVATHSLFIPFLLAFNPSLHLYGHHNY
jgi:hypothetical protein